MSSYDLIPYETYHGSDFDKLLKPPVHLTYESRKQQTLLDWIPRIQVLVEISNFEFYGFHGTKNSTAL